MTRAKADRKANEWEKISYSPERQKERPSWPLLLFDARPLPSLSADSQGYGGLVPGVDPASIASQYSPTYQLKPLSPDGSESLSSQAS